MNSRLFLDHLIKMERNHLLQRVERNHQLLRRKTLAQSMLITCKFLGEGRGDILAMMIYVHH